MPCEMCGKEARTSPHIVEGTEMLLCQDCGKFGKSVAAPVTEKSDTVRRVQHAQQRREQRSKPRRMDVDSAPTLALDYNKRVQKARAKSGLDQDEFAQKLGVKKSLIQHIERGDARPSDKVAKRIEREFNVKLFEAEPVAEPEAVKPSTPKGGNKNLTLGDLIKKAMKDEE